MHGMPSRRDFLERSGGAAFGAWLALHLSGCSDASRSAADAVASGDTTPRILTEDEMRTLDALSDRIIPADGDAPGASGARAVVFMDHYAAARPPMLEGIRAGLAGLPAGVADMSPTQQDDVVRGVEKDDPGFFQLLTFLTLVGTFGDPSRGGNRDQVGWRMLGFDGRHAWQPPFGYYDAQAMKSAQAGDA